MSKKSFLKKGEKSLVSAGIRNLEMTAGGVASQAASGLMRDHAGFIPSGLRNPILSLLGILGAAFSPNHHLESVADGFAHIASHNLVVGLLPSSIKDKIGLSGIGETGDDGDTPFIPNYVQARELASARELAGMDDFDVPSMDAISVNAAAAGSGGGGGAAHATNGANAISGPQAGEVWPPVSISAAS